jgi:hypothetical protein
MVNACVRFRDTGHIVERHISSREEKYRYTDPLKWLDRSNFFRKTEFLVNPAICYCFNRLNDCSWWLQITLWHGQDRQTLTEWNDLSTGRGRKTKLRGLEVFHPYVSANPAQKMLAWEISVSF